ncbi:MAG: bifunctional riboflavin kinase/FAD synthetase [Chloroflexota bacterium]
MATETSLENLLSKLTPERDTVLTIGVFDGVHLGHQFLIDTVKRRAAARRLLSGVITFECHPEEVLVPQCRLPWLSDTEERLEAIRGLGVDLVVALPFDREVAELGARQFLGLLQKHLRMKGLVVGPDFALGKGREGDVTALRALGSEMGFTVEPVPPFILDGGVVSSTAVRGAVARGDARKFRRLVGRYFTISGEVTRGAERGRKLGFPTANLVLDPSRAMPADGVYATWAYCGGKRYASVTNVGTRPTFGNGRRLAEVHVLDYDGDLYGRRLKVELVEKLREEKRFDSVQGLAEQMRRDVERARAVLEVEARAR